LAGSLLAPKVGKLGVEESGVVMVGSFLAPKVTDDKELGAV